MTKLYIGFDHTHRRYICVFGRLIFTIQKNEILTTEYCNSSRTAKAYFLAITHSKNLRGRELKPTNVKKRNG